MHFRQDFKETAFRMHLLHVDKIVKKMHLKCIGYIKMRFNAMALKIHLSKIAKSCILGSFMLLSLKRKLNWTINLKTK